MTTPTAHGLFGLGQGDLAVMVVVNVIGLLAGVLLVLWLIRKDR